MLEPNLREAFGHFGVHFELAQVSPYHAAHSTFMAEATSTQYQVFICLLLSVDNDLPFSDNYIPRPGHTPAAQFTTIDTQDAVKLEVM